MAAELPADIAGLIAAGVPLRYGAVVGVATWVGGAWTIEGTAIVLADTVLQLDVDAGADRAVRWAQSQHAVDLLRWRDRRALLEGHCRVLAYRDAPSVALPALVGMAAAWALWLPGVAFPALDLRVRAHRDFVARWVAALVGIGAEAAQLSRFEVAGRSGWQFTTAACTESYLPAGAVCSDPWMLDRAYEPIGRVGDEADPARALALIALQVALVKWPDDANAAAWTTRRDELLSEI